MGPTASDLVHWLTTDGGHWYSLNGFWQLAFMIVLVKALV